MQLEHSFTVPVGIDEAWRILLDIERIGPCMPGAVIESVDGDNFTGSVKVKLGPINLTYKGKAGFVDKDEAAHRAVIDARGRDARGNGTASAKVTANLSESGGTTTVRVATDLDITGKPAQFGRGVMVDVGNKLIGQFADCLAATITAGDAQGEAERAAAEPASAAGEQSPAAVSAAAVSAAAVTAAAVEETPAYSAPPAAQTATEPGGAADEEPRIPDAEDLQTPSYGVPGGLPAADPESLARVPGVGEGAAAAIRIVAAASERAAREKVAARPVLGDWRALLDYLHTAMAHHLTEQVRVLHLNTKNMLILDEVTGRGTIDQAPIYPRDVIRRALELGSTAVILVHNHPSGDPQPSRADIDVTRAIVEAGRPLGIAVHDHLIIGAAGHVSLRAKGLI